MKDQLGMANGIQMQLKYQPEWYHMYIEYRLQRGGFSAGGNERTILEWLKSGSVIEDEDKDILLDILPSIRPRHHFHDPIHNAGLDNKFDHPNYGELFAWTVYLYPGEFDATGQSAIVWAIEGTAPDKEPIINAQSWKDARDSFYSALTDHDPLWREYYFATLFLDIGAVLHLIEDMGVPAHTRNDFLFGHYQPPLGFGNDFENWVERIIADNNGQSPWSGSGPVVFDKLSKYFDANEYLGDYLGDGVLPPNIWGLSECSNYQFLSLSTMFGCSGMKYQFPHPAVEHVEPNMLVSVPEGYKLYFNGSNYGVTHIARQSYTYYITKVWGFNERVLDSTNTTDDVTVFEDYANITIPRTINYATGLLNYFFRGRLSIEQTDCNNGKIGITITNKSSNSVVGQILKGGSFILYWDDSSGNRTPVTDFTVYQPGTEPQPGNEWNSETLLNYDESTKAVLTPPESEDIQKYALVYEGIISANPESPDTDDNRQIATAVQKLSSPSPIDYFGYGINGQTGGVWWFNGCSIKCSAAVWGPCAVINRDDELLGFVYSPPHLYGISISCQTIKDFDYYSVDEDSCYGIEPDGFGNIILMRQYNSQTIVSKVSPIDGSALWNIAIDPIGCYQIAVNSVGIYLLIDGGNHQWVYSISHGGSASMIYDNPSRYTDVIKYIYADNYGNLWTCKYNYSYYGGYRYQGSIYKNGVIFLGGIFQWPKINSIILDDNGDIYIGTDLCYESPLGELYTTFNNPCPTGYDCGMLWKFNGNTNQIIWHKPSPYGATALRYNANKLLCLYGAAYLLNIDDGSIICNWYPSQSASVYNMDFVLKEMVWSTTCSASIVACDPPDSPKKRGKVIWTIDLTGGRGLSGALVSFSYSGAINGEGFATTDENGIATGYTPCTDATGSVTFTITGIGKSGYNYDASRNECTSAVCVF